LISYILRRGLSFHGFFPTRFSSSLTVAVKCVSFARFINEGLSLPSRDEYFCPLLSMGVDIVPGPGLLRLVEDGVIVLVAPQVAAVRVRLGFALAFRKHAASCASKVSFRGGRCGDLCVPRSGISGSCALSFASLRTWDRWSIAGAETCAPGWQETFWFSGLPTDLTESGSFSRLGK